MAPLAAGSSDNAKPVRDILGIAACVTSAALVLALSWFKLSSVDIGYHVAYGQYLLDHHHIVDRDPFIYPEHAIPFVNANWGSQAIMALAWRFGGSAGLIALRIALIVVMFAAIGIAVRRASGQWHWVAWTWLLAAAAAYERFSMRPELFSYAVLAVQFAVLMRGLRSARDIAALAILQLAWVNLHSYFLLGPMMSTCWLIGTLIERRRAKPGPDGQGGNLSAIRLLAVALPIQAAACLINPWHVHGAVFPIQTLGYLQRTSSMGAGAMASTDSPWAAISEFHAPFDHLGLLSHARTIDAYLVVLACAGAAALVALARRRASTVLVLALFVAISTQMRRNIAPFAIVGTPMAMVVWASAFSGSGWAGRAFRRGVRPILLAGAMALSAWWIAGIADGRFYYAERRLNREFGVGFGSRSFLKDALAWMGEQERRPDSQKLRPQLFCDYNASSNALLWLPERFKLFVDTNTFAVDEGILGLAQRLGNGQVQEDELSPGYNGIFRKFDVNVILLQGGADADGLIRQLAADPTEWAPVYVDRHAVIFVRRIPQHVPIIAANRLTPKSLDPKAWIEAVRGPAAYRAMELSTAAAIPMTLGRYEKAIALLDEVVGLEPDYHEAWINLGKCHGMRANAARQEGRSPEDAAGDLKAAIDCFARALVIHPADEAAQVNLEKARASLASLFSGPTQ